MVKNLANETLVKEALNINSFRNISKEKIIEFVSLIPNMDKDVAISIINQFPSFVDNAKTMVDSMKASCEVIIKANESSQTNVIEAHKIILDSLSKMLMKEDISFEEREYIINQMFCVGDRISLKDSENKKFNSSVLKCVSGTLLSLLVMCGVMLGVNASKYRS